MATAPVYEQAHLSLQLPKAGMNSVIGATNPAARASAEGRAGNGPHVVSPAWPISAVLAARG
jgi:hypothetical protein